MVKKIWFDITNTPQVHFLLSIKEMLSDDFSDFIFTARNFSETKGLLEGRVDKENLRILNSYYGKSTPGKIYSLVDRFNQIRKSGIDFDLSLSCGSDAAIFYSSLRKKRSIAFGDNDNAKQWTYSRFVDYAFFPDAIDHKVLENQGLRKKLYQYHGLKEDIYISYYKPDNNFMGNIPFSNYIVVRPENIHANYLKNSSVKSIVPQLLSGLSRKGYNIIYLPRFIDDKQYAKGINNIFIPEIPLNGLDFCYYSDAVLTGAGTLAREAACLGVPSFSFYAGNKLLAVDKKLIEEQKIFHSRDADTIIRLIKTTNKSTPDLSKSVTVREELKEKILEKIISFDK